jgi:toxin-antitoxin system PIN domain toxin
VIAPDVNVLLYAFREDSDRHERYRQWLEAKLVGPERIALLEPVLAAVVRIATHPAIYRTPAPRAQVEQFLDACLAGPSAVAMRPEAHHWFLFREMCGRADCRGNLIQDAFLAALALEHNCTYITTDRDFARFPRLRWQHPLDHARPTQNPS